MQQSKKKCFHLHKSNKKPEQSKALRQFLTSRPPQQHRPAASTGRGEEKRHETKFCFDCAVLTRLCLLFLSIVPATSVLLNRTGNCFSRQLVQAVAGAPPPHWAAGCLGRALEGWPWHPLRLGSHLTNGRADRQVVLGSSRFSNTLRWWEEVKNACLTKFQNGEVYGIKYKSTERHFYCSLFL